MLFVLPPLRGFWWSLGQGVSAQGVQFLSRTVRVRATPSYNLTFPAARRPKGWCRAMRTGRAPRATARLPAVVTAHCACAPVRRWLS